MATSRYFGSTSLTRSVADIDIAGRHLLEPGDHAHGRRLAAAGRSEQDEELLVHDLEVEIGHGDEAAETSW